MDWIKIEKGDSSTLPDIGVEVEGYNKNWYHPDFNPNCIRTCFLQDIEENVWFSAAWCDTMDSWQTLISGESNDMYHPYNTNNSDAPTYWKHKG